MNIFVLDQHPKLAAQMQCDRHVCKMSIEYAQILSTVHHTRRTNIAQTHPIYKATHARHPATLWAGAHPSHYRWVYDLMCETWEEYAFRYHRKHASSRLREYLRVVPDMDTQVQMSSPPPQCMPVTCKVADHSWESTVRAYRQYYMTEKAHFATWKSRTMPEWFMPNP